MRERLLQLALRLQDRPWNRPGADKTWVLQAMWQNQLLMREVRQATRAHRCGWIAAIFALCVTGCADLLEGDLAAGLVQLVASTEDNFRKSRSVSVIVDPADLALYRKLLPARFTMPEHPLVSISVVDQLEVGPWPLTPYQLGSVSLRCAYEGEEGWHPITMPETKWVAVWTGRTMGFPKYVADEIHLSPEGKGWVGEVRHADELRLRLAFVPQANPPVPRWKREGWSTGGPTLNLRPPGEGPEVKVVRGAEGTPGSSEEEPGHVRIDLGAAEPFAGLIPAGYEAPGVLVLWQGGTSLAPEG